MLSVKNAFLLDAKLQSCIDITNCQLGRPSNTTLQILSVKGGEGVPPKYVTPFSLKVLSVKGGRGVPPKSVTHFLPKMLSVKGGRGYPPYGQNLQSSI